MKNSELKTKKMSLANIDGRLSLEEMENIMAGSGGAWCSLVGFLYIPGMMMGAPNNIWISANARACWYS